MNNILKQLFYIIISVCSIFVARGQEKAKFRIISNEFLIDKDLNPDLIRFVGEVMVTHKQMKLFCDSVYQYQEANYIEAFGSVHIIQSDTINIYGDYLNYNGTSELAKLRDKVILKDNSVKLTTDSLNFDMKTNVSYFFNGGKIINKNNTLKSIIGRYYIKDNLFFFKDSVYASNNEYTLRSDTLKYNSLSGIATILGPTEITNGEEVLYSEKGKYNTLTNKAYMLENTNITHGEYKIFGDSIFTDSHKQISELYNNVILRDTVNNFIMKSNYLEVFKLREKSMMKDSALLIMVENNDSLFMHANKFILDKDSSGNKIIYAYDNVKFFRSDLQGMCDSLVYSMKDSVMSLYKNPVIWAEGNQISADTINIIAENKKIKFIDFLGSAYMCSKEDSIFYNQVKGRKMRAFVKNNVLRKIDVNGNAETLYYPKDKDVILGMNTAKSSKLTVALKNKEIDKIMFMKKPEGNMYPLLDIKDEMLYLKDFNWLENFRPKNKDDVFLHKQIFVK